MFRLLPLGEKAMKIIDSKTKAAHVAAWKMSGVALTEYARENGISKTTLRYWVSKQQGKNNIEKSTPGFLELSSLVEQPEMFSPVSSGHTPKAVLRFAGGLTLEIY